MPAQGIRQQWQHLRRPMTAPMVGLLQELALVAYSLSQTRKILPTRSVPGQSPFIAIHTFEGRASGLPGGGRLSSGATILEHGKKSGGDCRGEH